MRLEGQMKLGYYPAHKNLVRLAASRIVPHPRGTILDPCAGNGGAISELAKILGIKPERVYAIELDEGRSANCAKRKDIGNVLAGCDTLNAKIGDGWSLAWLNPPFSDEIGGGRLRVEAEFFSAIAKNSRLGSLLLFIAKWKQIQEMLPTMRMWSTRIYWEVVPEQWAPYGECIVYCVMSGQLDRGYYCDDSRALKPGEQIKLQMPLGFPITPFEKGGYTDQDLIRLANESKAIELFNVNAGPKALRRPPLELSSGHLAMMLAAGHLNGVVSTPGLPVHVVRGTASKQKYEKSRTPKGDKETIVYGERIRLVIRCLFPDGSIKTLESSEETQIEEDEVDE